jgi:hypothetical protein
MRVGQPAKNADHDSGQVRTSRGLIEAFAGIKSTLQTLRRSRESKPSLHARYQLFQPTLAYQQIDGKIKYATGKVDG